MTEASKPSSEKQTSYPVTDSQSSFPGTETALLVTAAALIVISVLARVNVIHQVGTLSSNFIAYASLSGSLGLTASAALIALIKHYCSQEEIETLPQISSDTVTVEEQIPELEFSEKADLETEVRRSDSNSSRLLFYSKKAGVEETFYPSEFTFKIEEQKVTLYGIFPRGLRIEKRLIERLQRSGGSDLKMLNILGRHSSDLALKVGDKFLVAARHYIHVKGETSKKINKEYAAKDTFKITISGTGKELLILGAEETLNRIDLVDNPELASADEISLIMLNLGAPVTPQL